MVEGLVSMFRLRAESKGLRFEMIMDTRCPRSVLADQGRIRQILINLLGNAVKFTERGAIKLWTSAQRRKDDKLLFSASLEDTGLGISAQEQRKHCRSLA